MCVCVCVYVCVCVCVCVRVKLYILVINAYLHRLYVCFDYFQVQSTAGVMETMGSWVEEVLMDPSPPKYWRSFMARKLLKFTVVSNLVWL